MLQHLRVRNLGVLVDASIEPSPGFTVITGETGAGKTLLIGGLRLVLGEKSDPSLVGAIRDHAQADGLFDEGDEELGVSRIVPESGRSQAHLEGSIVSAAALTERVGDRVEIVGQHDQLRLKRANHVLALLDTALDESGQRALEDYRDSWDSLQALVARQKLVGGDEMALRRELDLVTHQTSEIDDASLEPGCDVAAEDEASRLRNSEEILEHLAASSRLAESLGEQAGEAVSYLRKVVELDPGARELVAQSESVFVDAAELNTALRSHRDLVDSDPEVLATLDRRLTLIGDLKRKYGQSISEILEFRDQASARLEELTGLLSEASEIESKLDTARSEVGRWGEMLAGLRHETAAHIELEVVTHLADMGLERASVGFVFDEKAPGPTGTERVEFVFRSDQQLAPGPISSVASGGELSRLVLAIRLATTAPETETLVFDEVDAGVGGATALALGEKIADLARDSQVLCVTHLPQIAAFADSHYVVERHEAVAQVRLVAGGERVAEISRMLAGMPDSMASHETATELLAMAGGSALS